MGDNAYREPNRFVARDGGDVGSQRRAAPNTRALRIISSDRKGIRLAQRICEELRSRGDAAVLIEARAIGLPIMDRMYKEYAPGEAPAQMKALATKIRQADAFAFIVGECNWGVQPGLKNLTDHFLEECFWRPAAIASYSAGLTAGVRVALAWRSTLSEMGMVVVSSTPTVGPIEEALDVHGRPTGELGRSLGVALPLFLEDLA
jgi:NAD(P)H-dependent FMN reductase